MKTKNSLPLLFIGALLSAPAGLVAAEDKVPDYGWSGKGEFGLVSSTGNSDNRSLKLALEAVYDTEKWRHRAGTGAIYAKSGGETTAKRYDLGLQSDYKFSQKSYVYGAWRYENDDFSAFEDQSTVTLGYGRQLLDNEKYTLKLEGGAGYRQATIAATGESESGAVFRGAADFSWQLTPSTSFGERFLIEAGSDNVYIQNDLGLTVAINSRFAVNLGFQLRSNSEVPSGVKKTDTLTSANLVYHY